MNDAVHDATGNCGISLSSAQAKREETEKSYATATKADDAAVPVHLWDRRALGLAAEDGDLLGKTVELRARQSRALNALRQACLGSGNGRRLRTYVLSLDQIGSPGLRCVTLVGPDLLSVLP